jgi:hypothetical protein
MFLSEINLERVLELVNAARAARGLDCWNGDGDGAVDLQTATMPDLMEAEHVEFDRVTFHTMREAKAVAKAWTEALPYEFGTRHTANLFGSYTVRLPKVLSDFMKAERT